MTAGDLLLSISRILLLPMVFFTSHTVCMRCDSGGWEQVDPSKKLSRPNYARTGLNLDDIKKGLDLWLENACPIETLEYSCYYYAHNEQATVERISRAENRRFVPDGNACFAFSPLEFLDIIANRKLLLTGDSTMMQIFITLVCALHHAAESALDVTWHHNFDDERVCPFKAYRCYVNQGSVRYFNRNATIEGVVNYMYHWTHFFNIIFEAGMTQDDILLFSYGAHYNQPGSFEAAIKELLADLAVRLDTGLPRLFYLQALPQHFSTPTGYWNESAGRSSTECKPAIEAANYSSVMEATDWRNRIAEKHIVEYNERVVGKCKEKGISPCPVVNIVYLARPLYSQSDAHMETATVHPHFAFAADCTHYCSTSAVFDVIQTMIYNALVDHFEIRSKLWSQRVDYILKGRSEMLVQSPGSQVYLLKKEGKYAFKSSDSLTKKGYDDSNAHLLSNEILNSIPLAGELS